MKAVGIAEWGNCQITLVKDNKNLATLQGTTGIFTNQGYGQYQAIATVGNQRDSSIMLTSKTINISPSLKTQRDPINIPCTETTNTIKSLRQRFDGIDEYYLYFRLKSAQDIARLHSAIASPSSTLSCLKNSIILSSVQNHLLGDMLPNTYKIHCEGDYDELVRIADALELLDYVVYCSVTPNTHNMKPPHLSPNQLILDEGKSSVASVTQEVQTPNFQPLQTYLQPSSDTIRGMNVLSVWEHGEIGQAATVRHLDFGVYRDHENLKGNINVVHSRPETEECNHGTASTGCIVAANKPFGVAGIAHGSDFYFYDTDDIELIIRDAMPGDIVSLDIQLVVGGNKFVPMITDRNWWDWIYSLTQNGVVVILAAANGGLDLSNESGNINYYGDSGSTLISACAHNDGSRCSFSNYNHPSSLINSWGDWSVVTTGYSSLQSLPGNNRNYTKDYSGTSSATPLSSGALALIQSYAITHLGLYLNSLEMRDLISKTGYIIDAGLMLMLRFVTCRKISPQ